MYSSISTKFINETDPATVDWIYNILNHDSESDRIFYENPDPLLGYIVLPDFKWDTVNLATLHLIALVHDKNLKSLRDLDSSHLPLLKDIKLQVSNVLKSRYPDFDISQLLFYVHYHPSFYHLHIHISNINTESQGMISGRAHILDQVIDNIENISPNYYQKATLPVVFGQKNKLYSLLTNV
ncbi:hypothetical protein BB560_005368 [Smittium megazygosporum]|uniref:HIT domain-containing protein n=1 Tax=Smittium megazygosporum TaxID=133381 RepID=A0A2T9Z6T6_9FUNG|nr:hypothetical protein BB560_005368 [Smittium megazygosporum]